MQRTENSSKFMSLRKDYPFFIYESFDYKINNERIKLLFNFNLSDKYFFKPEITIPVKDFFLKEGISEELLQKIVFNIGMVEMASYWKAVCSPVIIVKCAYLNQKQIDWWNNLYFKGLGEFRYLNSIDIEENEFLKIEVDENHKQNYQDFNLSACKTEDSYIVPIGGGKDSIVSLNLLQKQGKKLRCMIMNPSDTTLDTIVTAGYNRNDIIEVNRSIYPDLLRMNTEGFLNGHTPFSALLAFVSVLTAVLTGTRNIALSNEASANESTIMNTDINHQYSKSYKFEKDFREYVNKYITTDINYFSLLRPLYEIQIAKLFAKNDKFFGVFKSCNAGSKTNIWCCKCPKCLFTFIILSPFIDINKLTLIFGENLLEKPELINIFKELTGIDENKPFECVGTTEEVNFAVCALIKSMNTGKLPFLLDYYVKSYKFDTYKDLSFDTILRLFNDEHFLNKEQFFYLLTELNEK